MKVEEVELKDEGKLWDVLEAEKAESKRLKLETGKEYTISIRGVGVKKLHIEEVGGKIKVVPALVLYLDSLDNEKYDGEVWVTSKKLQRIIKVFHTNGDLFKKTFKIIKMGTGLQTNYVFVPVSSRV